MEEVYTTIGKKITQLRKESRPGWMSQADLAKKMKVTPNTVSRWETGTYKIQIHQLIKVANIFKVGINEFFKL
jgi:transcriptional regulator with XRE-family HTH domain